jgi:hypothetical protein
VKYALDDLQKMSKSFQDVFCAMSTKTFVEKLSEITGIKTLEYDPWLNGAGFRIVMS